MKTMNGRGERIRTSGPYVPNVVLYQAELHPEDLTLVGAGDSEVGQYLQRVARRRFGKQGECRLGIRRVLACESNSVVNGQG